MVGNQNAYYGLNLTRCALLQHTLVCTEVRRESQFLQRCAHVSDPSLWSRGLSKGGEDTVGHKMAVSP